MAKALVRNLSDLAQAFLLHKKVSGCSEHTLEIFRLWIDRFLKEVVNPDPLSSQQFVARWHAKRLKPSTLQRGVRALAVFFKWCVSTGALANDPMRGVPRIRLPRTLPKVPSDSEVRAALSACDKDALGLRNKALILTLGDAGLRVEEITRLMVAHWNPAARSLLVRGKGGKDRMSFVGLPTVRVIREYLATRQLKGPDDFLFVNKNGTPMNRRHILQILHRLSKKAGLPNTRRLHPHALRHYAATSWIRSGIGLDEVRRLLGHESLSTTLRYSSLVSADLQAAHRKAAVIERLHLASQSWLP